MDGNNHMPFDPQSLGAVPASQFSPQSLGATPAPGVFQPKTPYQSPANSALKSFLNNGAAPGVQAPSTNVMDNFSLGSGIQQTADAIAKPAVGLAKDFGNDVSGAFSGGVNQVKQGVGQIGAGNGNPVDFLEGVGRVGSGIVSSLLSPTAPVMKPVNTATNFVADKISDSPTVQKFADSTAGKVTSRVAENAGNFANIAGAVGGAMETPKIAETGANAVNAVGEAAKPGLQAVGKDIASVADVPGKVAQGLENKYVNQAKTEWTKPTTIAKPAFNKATEIFKNAKTDIADTLVKNKLNPADHIDNGVYSTAETADKIRADAGKASADILKPSLQKADAVTPVTSISDITNQAIKDIQNSKGITPGDMKTQIAKAKAEGLALQEKYPNGMKLSEMHDENISYAKNGGYKPMGTVDDNNLAATNRAFGRTLDKQVATKAPSDIPVKQFKAELQKQYQAADYLDALNNKKAPVGMGTKIARSAAKVAGAAVGNTLGGGLLGGVGGYHIGGLVESMFENMSNPVKNSFLRNLETTNPEAFTKVQDYLNRPAPELKTPNVGLSIKDVSPQKLQGQETYSRLQAQKIKLLDQGLSENSPAVKNIIKSMNKLKQ